MLKYLDAKDCTFDILSLGEIMLRLDPADSRIHTARRFDVWEGGGEYNVARGMRRCFGLRAAAVTAFASAYLAVRILRYLAEEKGFGSFAYYNWGMALFTLVLTLMA